MGDWIKRAVLLAIVGVGGYQGWRYWKGREAPHQIVFRAEGPAMCQVRIRHEAGEAVGNEGTSLEWQSEAVQTQGNVNIALTVDIPLSCGWQPSQVHCFVERDGAPWKQADAERINDPRDGSLASYRCAIEASVSE